MKNTLSKATIFFCLLSIAACEQDNEPEPTQDEEGYVQGIVKDTQGKPIEGAHIVIDNTLIYDSNLTVATDEQGVYKIKLPGHFTWMAYAQLQQPYHGETFVLDLNPDNAQGFTSQGAIRNFEWKLNGKRPGGPSTGYYGGLITFDAYPGIWDVDNKAIEFILTPVGPLIDGTLGQVLKLSAADGYQLLDIPIGRYSITASYQGVALKLRQWNTDHVFSSVLEIDFQSQVEAHCYNCVKLEYNK
ncbi:carboxypeptidase-like regulatory domain-containing protein [Catalinimonas niigatensis]|uniref:carboxypeptidase-like regulatory domain-containing protein n=1 Tax=Catalinimonas niigatensis TaxID=1397264 RepID=UPI002666BCC4|nr:carboxypeptidase-like regulatory domain-containing protein [Catalinimonas niigatensis]WPP51885.1 carboxypeptidase-like regulatory domain-containing protein [Catalinimonas niigatensis]